MYHWTWRPGDHEMTETVGGYAAGRRAEPQPWRAFNDGVRPARSALIVIPPGGAADQRNLLAHRPTRESQRALTTGFFGRTAPAKPVKCHSVGTVPLPGTGRGQGWGISDQRNLFTAANKTPLPSPLRAQISPIWILHLDQVVLPLLIPVFQFLFALNCRPRVRVFLNVDGHHLVVFAGVGCGRCLALVFPDTAFEIGGEADVGRPRGGRHDGDSKYCLHR